MVGHLEGSLADGAPRLRSGKDVLPQQRRPGLDLGLGLASLSKNKAGLYSFFFIKGNILRSKWYHVHLASPTTQCQELVEKSRMNCQIITWKYKRKDRTQKKVMLKGINHIQQQKLNMNHYGWHLALGSTQYSKNGFPKGSRKGDARVFPPQNSTIRVSRFSLRRVSLRENFSQCL
jgi:hypothetical protein